MPKKKITQRDFDHVAEYLVEQWKTRVKNRASLDYQIKEIDRQVDMVPDVSHKQDRFGKEDPNLRWLPEVELPLQAEALETLTAEARSMQFPDAGPWFLAHAATTDEYLERADFSAIIAGDEAEIPSEITQDNADKLAAGYIEHLHRQYDFRGHMDLINAEAMSYGVGIGRARMVTKQVIRETAKGLVPENQRIPVLIPRSLKETYLDDREHILMQEGYLVGPMTIFHRKMLLKDLTMRAKGNTDPSKEDGGWIAKNVSKLEAEKDGVISLLEAEGDFVIPRKTTGSFYLPGTIFTIAIGKNDRKVVRVQIRQFPFDSVLVFPYHKERVGTVYATSPLRKGRPLQAAAVEALMRVVEVSALHARPPISYDRSDMWFAESGGPIIEPGAVWATLGDLKVHNIGEVKDMFSTYVGFLSQYADAVGVQRARLGAKTVSHTTAFAKNVELQQGAVRTVDYVRSTLQGPLVKWLGMCYEMGRKNFNKKQTFYIDAYRGFVTIGKEMLPEKVVFDAHGSGGPQEESQKRAEKNAALEQALAMDQMNVQLGGKPTLNLPAMIQSVLVSGGWTDTDPFLVNEDQETPDPLEQLDDLG